MNVKINEHLLNTRLEAEVQRMEDARFISYLWKIIVDMVEGGVPEQKDFDKIKKELEKRNLLEDDYFFDN